MSRIIDTRLEDDVSPSDHVVTAWNIDDLRQVCSFIGLFTVRLTPQWASERITCGQLYVCSKPLHLLVTGSNWSADWWTNEAPWLDEFLFCRMTERNFDPRILMSPARILNTNALIVYFLNVTLIGLQEICDLWTFSHRSHAKTEW